MTAPFHIARTGLAARVRDVVMQKVSQRQAAANRRKRINWRAADERLGARAAARDRLTERGPHERLPAKCLKKEWLPIEFPVGTFSGDGCGIWRSFRLLRSVLLTSDEPLEPEVLSQRVEVEVDLEPARRQPVRSCPVSRTG
jgi:hypothetical protein